MNTRQRIGIFCSILGIVMVCFGAWIFLPVAIAGFFTLVMHWRERQRLPRGSSPSGERRGTTR